MKKGTLLLLLFIACSSSVKPYPESVRKHFKDIKRDILKDSDTIKDLPEIRILNTGFYYIINLKGTVRQHPVTPLIGKDFSRYPFVREILERKTGCFICTIGGMKHTIYFERISKNEILCLTVPLIEMKRQDTQCDTLNLNNK